MRALLPLLLLAQLATAQTGTDDGVRSLTAQLDDPDPAAQVRASLRLRDLGPRAAPAVTALVRRLRNPSPVQQPAAAVDSTADSAAGLSPARAAALALVAIGDPSVTPLVAALRHSDPQERAVAAWALGELKAAAAADPLVEALADPKDLVRRMAVEALGKLRDPRTIPMISSTAASDENAAVRSAARVAQRNVSEIPLLLTGLRDSSRVVRENAAYLLWLLTAKDFRNDAGQWEAWWREEGSRRQGPADSLKAGEPAEAAPPQKKRP